MCPLQDLPVRHWQVQLGHKIFVNGVFYGHDLKICLSNLHKESHPVDVAKIQRHVMAGFPTCSAHNCHSSGCSLDGAGYRSFAARVGVAWLNLDEAKPSDQEGSTK